jgi:hypothetical protein
MTIALDRPAPAYAGPENRGSLYRHARVADVADVLAHYTIRGLPADGTVGIEADPAGV